MPTAKLNRILVPTDFSETAGHALRHASDLARGLGASLTVLYSDPFVPSIDCTATVGGWFRNEEVFRGTSSTRKAAELLLLDPVHFVMERKKMMLGIKARAERT